MLYVLFQSVYTEDSGMMDTKELSACTGVFTDMKTGKIVGCSNHEAFYYTAEMGY